MTAISHSLTDRFPRPSYHDVIGHGDVVPDDSNPSLLSPVTVFRGLNIPHSQFMEYKLDQQLLLPTSPDPNVTATFGQYMFEIDDGPGEGVTYYAHSAQYPHEQEILIYPYSGFQVTGIDRRARTVHVQCCDTQQQVHNAKQPTPNHVALYDASRDISVHIKQNDPNLYWGYSRYPTEWYLIDQNLNGYWDSPYRFHHKDGYFLNLWDETWEEYQQTLKHATFEKVENRN